MRDISNIARSDSYSETSGEAGDSSTSLTGKAFFKDLIRRANTVPIILIFKHYGLPINQYNRKIICPFKSHQGGRERSGSFTYYPATNSYCCYGCRLGSFGCDFVAAIDGITLSKSAYKILSLFDKDVDIDSNYIDVENSSERLKIMLEFSNVVREFRQSFCDDNAYEYIEHICLLYDRMFLKYKDLDIETIKSIVDDFKKDINKFNAT